MTSRKEICVSFSGHRTSKMNAGGELFPVQDTRPMEEKLRSTLERLYAEGFRVFLCGMAEGFDLMAGEAVVDLKGRHPDTRLTAVIPHRGHGDRLTGEIRRRYDAITGSADEVVTICGEYRNDCFHRRNDYLTDNSSLLVCCYNGTPGGTRYTVKRAAKMGLGIINLWNAATF